MTLKSVFLPRYESLKLNHDKNYLMTSEDTVEDPLMSVQFYKKSQNFSFRVTVHLLFSFLLQKTLKSVFLPRYKSLKLNHDTNLFDDIWRHGWRSVDECSILYKGFFQEEFFSFRVTVHLLFSIFIAKDALICISTTPWIFKTKPWHELFDDIWRHGWRSVDECSILYKEQEFFPFVLSPSTVFIFIANDA